MSNQSIYHSIILKKQPFAEADEIITLFTLEAGKIRVLAKSSKAAKSKLQHALQSLFLVNVTLTGSRDFPKVIGAEIEQTFAAIREDLTPIKYAFYAAELVLKFSPDEQKNEPLFELLRDFLNFLSGGEILPAGLLKFKINFLDAVGLSLPQADVALNGERELFGELQFTPFADLLKLRPPDGILAKLQRQLSEFIRFQLEREVKSEGFLDL